MIEPDAGYPWPVGSVRFTLVALSYRTGLPLSELLEWHPRDLATLTDIIEEERAAEKRARRKG